MKNLLYIVSLLAGIMLFIHTDNSSKDSYTLSNKAAVLMEKTASEEMQNQFETLSADLKSNKFLTPRRTLQQINPTTDPRSVKLTERSLSVFRLKNINELWKTSEVITNQTTVDISSLRCSMGRHVYSLRKLII